MIRLGAPRITEKIGPRTMRGTRDSQWLRAFGRSASYGAPRLTYILRNQDGHIGPSWYTPFILPCVSSSQATPPRHCSTPTIPSGDTVEFPRTGPPSDREEHSREHCGAGSPAQTAHTGDTQRAGPPSTARNTAAVAVPLKRHTPATPAHVQPGGVTASSSHQITLGTMPKGSRR